MALVRRQDAGLRPARGWDAAGAGVGGFLDELGGLFSELATPTFSGAQWARGYPVDVYETAEAYVVEMAVPGIKAEDLDVSIEGRQLRVRGSLPEDPHEGRRYWLRAIPRGEFSRTISLPVGVDAGGIRAEVESGLLVLRLPKAAEARARRITVGRG